MGTARTSGDRLRADLGRVILRGAADSHGHALGKVIERSPENLPEGEQGIALPGPAPVAASALHCFRMGLPHHIAAVDRD